MGKKKTREEFIKDARDVHGDKYDYSKVKYINAKTKVCIICPEHGEFLQTPNSHLSGNGCPKCANEANSERFRLPLSEFIKKAKDLHKDKYDYSKVDYVNDRTKVCIICPEDGHGEFWQTPNAHTNGAGCPKCSSNYAPTTEEWIASARKVHGDKYDYSKVKYVNSVTKVCIICPEHGTFLQGPSQHLSGKGCSKCSNNYSPTKEEWITYAREVHGNKYDYSKVEYVNALTKVCIICPEHGEFWQGPHSHTKGQGCPKCNLSHLERCVMNYLDEKKITYDYQTRFKWLGRQSLDFYLPDYNVGIECQGEQHFFPVERFGGDKGLNKCKKRDKLKFKKCQKNGIKVLYYSNLGIEYPYDVFEDLDSLFKEFKN